VKFNHCGTEGMVHWGFGNEMNFPYKLGRQFKCPLCQGGMKIDDCGGLLFYECRYTITSKECGDDKEERQHSNTVNESRYDTFGISSHNQKNVETKKYAYFVMDVEKI